MKKTLLFISIFILGLGLANAQLLKSMSRVQQQKQNTKFETSESYFRLGYCTNYAPEVGLGGVPNDMYIENFIELTPKLLSKYVGDSICAINIGLAYNYANSKAIIRVGSVDSPNVSEKTYNGSRGWNEVKLNSAVIIEANKSYFVGYAFTLTAKTYGIGISESSVDKGAFLMKMGADGQFNDVTTEYGALTVQALLKGKQEHFPTNKADIIDVYLDKYQINGSKVSASTIIENKGINKINKLEFSYKYGSDEFVKRSINVDIKPYDVTLVELDGILINKSGEIAFTISKIADKVVKTDTIVKNIIDYDTKDTVKRKVLLEQFTGEKCVYCPLGASIIKGVLDRETYKNRYIWVAHHAGYYDDKYTITASKEYTRLYGGDTYAPAYMLDRTVFSRLGVAPAPVTGIVPNNPKIFEDHINAALNIPSFTTVNIEQKNNTNDKVDITLSGVYTGKENKDDLYVVVFLTEDGLKSSDQAGVNGGGEYTHNHLIRSVVTSTVGTKPIWDGNKYTIKLTATIAKEWNRDNMKVVGFMAKNFKNKLNNVNVLNAEVAKLSIGTGVENVYSRSLKVYSNSGKVNVLGEYTSFKIFDLNGKELKNENLQKGIYIVNIKNNINEANKKIIIL